MAWKIALILSLAIAAIFVLAAGRPTTFQVQRSIIIQASPQKIFALLDDFHNWSRWAPQDKEDPTMRRTFSGAASGPGAISEWTSSGSAGTGRMTITQSTPPRIISVQVDFVKPFRAHNLNQFMLESRDSSTQVTWTMRGTNLYIMKLMSIFINIDRSAGKHFESGLESLKRAAEQ